MDKHEMRQLKISALHKRIRQYEDRVRVANHPFLKWHYTQLIIREKNRLKRLERMVVSEKIFTSEELSKYDGSNGKPAYVAVDGVVYDVSMEPAWGGGTHNNLYAGKDLTEEFLGCHGGNEKVLAKLPKVGILKD